jgi:EAL domain-containing protein (putative c-di-GMP-specific phosphodiesterase class I)
MPLDTESMAIVRAIASLAQSLEVRLSAEGIETPAQLEMLRLLGCEEGQGFLFGRAISEAEVHRMMSSTKPVRSLAWAS